MRDVIDAKAKATDGRISVKRLLPIAPAAGYRAAGLERITTSASAWCFASPEDRTWWAGTWARRTTDSPLADRAVELNLASHDELEEFASAWHTWAAEPDASFLVVHGEVLAEA